MIILTYVRTTRPDCSAWIGIPRMDSHLHYLLLCLPRTSVPLTCECVADHRDLAAYSDPLDA